MINFYKFAKLTKEILPLNFWQESIFLSIKRVFKVKLTLNSTQGLSFQDLNLSELAKGEGLKWPHPNLAHVLVVLEEELLAGAATRNLWAHNLENHWICWWQILTQLILTMSGKMAEEFKIEWEFQCRSDVEVIGYNDLLTEGKTTNTYV